jgi:hypothetical protein
MGFSSYEEMEEDLARATPVVHKPKEEAMTDYEETEDPQEDWAGFKGGADTHLEEGAFYGATLTGLNIIWMPSKWPERPDGMARAIEWLFTLDDLDPNGNVVTVKGTSSLATGKKSRAYPWLSALVGRDRADAAGKTMIRKEVLIGRECTITIVINDSGYPKVDAVLKAQGPRRTAPEPQASPDTDPAPVEAPRAVLDAPEASDELRCEEFGEDGRCVRPAGHEGAHRVANGVTWK